MQIQEGAQRRARSAVLPGHSRTGFGFVGIAMALLGPLQIDSPVAFFWASGLSQ